MAQPGTSSPRNLFPKGSDGGTKLPETGSKTVKEEALDFRHGAVSNIGPAPSSRVYTRDYTKVGRAKDDQDLVTEALGKNPFRI